tara:strand:+ start:56 stop:481 length:426 start_codon:yes stop_codon:yes gene_type:complete
MSDSMFFIRDTYINIDPFFSEKGIKALNHIFNALVNLSPLLIFLYYYYFKKHDGSAVINSVDDVQKLEKKRYYMSIIKGVGLALLYFLFAIRVYWYYAPNNTEVTLAILINYLRNNEILDENIYEILRLYKPENISQFVEN